MSSCLIIDHATGRAIFSTKDLQCLASKKVQQKEKVPLEWLKKLCGSQSGRDFVRDMANGYSVYLTEQSVIGGFGVTPTVNGTPTNDIFIARTISPQVLNYFNRFYGFTGDQANFQIATLAQERGHIINYSSGRPITGNGDEAFARFYGDLVADSLGLSPLYPKFGFNYADYVGGGELGCVTWKLGQEFNRDGISRTNDQFVRFAVSITCR